MPRILLVVLLIASITASHADADVIPVKTLFHVLDTTPQLKRSHPAMPIRDWRYYIVRGTDVAGYIAPEFNDYGFIRTGADLLIVPLASGGSGGVFDALLFTGIGTKPRFVGYVPSESGHLSVTIEEGNIVVSTPDYRSGDPNCCPSGQTYKTYTLNGIVLKKVDERSVKWHS